MTRLYAPDWYKEGFSPIKERLRAGSGHGVDAYQTGYSRYRVPAGQDPTGYRYYPMVHYATPALRAQGVRIEIIMQPDGRCFCSIPAAYTLPKDVQVPTPGNPVADLDAARDTVLRILQATEIGASPERPAGPV